MKNARRLALLWLISVFLAGTAHATTSTVNPNVPAQNSPLSSSVLRNGISQPAYNDITTLLGYLTLGANQTLVSLSAGLVQPVTIPPCATALTWTNGTGYGCALSASGVTALTGDVTATGTGSVTATLANTPTARTDIGLGTASTPVFAGLTINGVAKVNLNAASLPAAQTGTVLQTGNADTVITRDEIDAFGAAGHFTAVRWDGTNASPNALLSADAIGSFNVFGYNGTAVVGPQAAIRCFANQNWSVGSNGTYCDIATTPNGSSTLTQILKFENDGGMDTPGVTGGDKGAGTLNVAGVYSAGTQLQNGSFTAGSNVTITGSWPNLTISATAGSGSGTVNSGTLGQLAYYGSTGAAVSGSTALFISSTGSIGVGTTTPGYNIDIQGTSNITENVSSSSTIGTSFRVANTSSGGHAYDFTSVGSGGGNVGCFSVADENAVVNPLQACAGTKTISILQNGVWAWNTSNAFGNATYDTGISRGPTAGMVLIGNGTAASTAGSVKTAGYISAGTKFTASGCSNSATVGGATAGTITLGANSCSVTITLNGATGLTAPNGWDCQAKDLTAPTILIGESPGSATTCVLVVPSGAGATDVISFHAMAY